MAAVLEMADVFCRHSEASGPAPGISAGSSGAARMPSRRAGQRSAVSASSSTGSRQRSSRSAAYWRSRSRKLTRA